MKIIRTNVAVLFLMLSVSLIQQNHAHTRHVRGNGLEDVRELRYLDTSDVEKIVGVSTNNVKEETNVQRCATPEMTEKDRIDRAKALALYEAKKDKLGAMYNANSPKVIPVCIHVVGRRISKRKLNKDFAALNKAYSTGSCCDSSLDWCNGECNTVDTNIRFVMAKSIFKLIVGTTKRPSSLFSCVTWTPIGSLRPGTISEALTKAVLRRGGSKTLNIYYTSIGDGIAGYAYPPSILDSEPLLDGVVIDVKARVDGPIQKFNEGDTLAHEVG